MKSNQNDNLNLNQKANKQRRKLLMGSAAAGSALTVWHKPIIESMLIPAHAQTSDDVNDINFFASQASATQVVQNSNPVFDFIVPKAVAQSRVNLNEYIFSAEAISNNDGSYEIKVVAERVAIADDFAPDSETQPQEGSGFKFSVSEPQERVAIQNEWGWSGTLTQTGAALLIGTGCANDETSQIISVSASALELQMGFYGSMIKLNLTPGTTTLPNFPLSCTPS